MDQIHVETVTGQVTQPVPSIQLETRVCVAAGCGKPFRVLASSQQRYCSNFCHPDGASIAASHTRQPIPARKAPEYFSPRPTSGVSSGVPLEKPDEVKGVPAENTSGAFVTEINQVSKGNDQVSAGRPMPVMTHEEVENGNEEEVEVSKRGMIGARELAEELGISQASVYNWAKAGRIPYQRGEDGKSYYVLSEVKKALDREKEKDETPDSEPAEKSRKRRAQKATKTESTPAADPVEFIKKEGLKRAYGTYRKFILAAADEAERQGEFELQASLLKEYIAAGKDIAARMRA